MNCLPQELVDAILSHLFEETHPLTERFPTLTRTSLFSILNSRLVCRAFFNSKPLTDLFVTGLEQTPFMRSGETTPELEAVSLSPYRTSITTLSLCGLTEYDDPPKLWNSDTSRRLSLLLRRFPGLKHLRFYTLPRQTLPGDYWDRWDITALGSAGNFLRYSENELQLLYSASLTCILIAFYYAEVRLKTLAMPLFGNRAAWCATSHIMSMFPESLTRLAINGTGWSHRPVFDFWLRRLQNLEFLDVALAMLPVEDERFGRIQRLVDESLAPGERLKLPKLTEFRFMADNRHCFSERNILAALSAFPGLKILALGHVMLVEGSWRSMLARFQALKLDKLWLLEPRAVLLDQDPMVESVLMLRYQDGGMAENAGREVRLIYTDVVDDGYRVPRVRTDVEYPGFALFEIRQEHPGTALLRRQGDAWVLYPPLLRPGSPEILSGTS